MAQVSMKTVVGTEKDYPLGYLSAFHKVPRQYRPVAAALEYQAAG